MLGGPQSQQDCKLTKKTDHPGAVVPTWSTAFHLLRSAELRSIGRGQRLLTAVGVVNCCCVLLAVVLGGLVADWLWSWVGRWLVGCGHWPGGSDFWGLGMVRWMELEGWR